MSKDGFKDRIYWVQQETPEECEKRETEEAEQERVDGLCSTYNGLGRAYGNFIPGTREKIDSATS